MSFISSVSAQSYSGTSISTSAFTTSGSNRLLIVAVGYGGSTGGTKITSVTRDGQNLTRIGGFSVAWNGDHYAELFAIAAPNTTSAAVTVNFSTTMYGLFLHAQVYDNAVQSGWTVGERTWDKAGGSASFDTTLVMPATGDMFAYAWASHQGGSTWSGTPTWDGGTTQLGSVADVGIGWLRGSAARRAGVSGTQTVTWNTTLSGAAGTSRVFLVAIPPPVTNTNLAPNSESHTHALSAPVLTAKYSLAPVAASHAHTLAAAALTSNLSFAPVAATHTHVLGAAALSTGLHLAPAAEAHGHSLSAATLAVNTVLAGVAAAHTHTLAAASLTLISALPAVSVSHAHSLSAAALTVGVQLVPASLAHSHVLGAASFLAGNTASGNPLAHAHVLGAPALTLANYIAPASMVHTQPLIAAVVYAAGFATPAAETHAHALSAASLLVNVFISPASLTHAQVEAIAGITKHVFLSPVALSHLHSLNVAGLSSGTLVVPAALSHAHALSTAGATLIMASDLTQVTTGFKPTLSTVPGAKAAAAGFNSFLFDADDKLECEFNTAGLPVFYAWLDDGTEQTTYTSATGGILTFSAPAGRKILLAVAHPSAITPADLAKFRALAAAIRT